MMPAPIIIHYSIVYECLHMPLGIVIFCSLSKASFVDHKAKLENQALHAVQTS